MHLMWWSGCCYSDWVFSCQIRGLSKCRGPPGPPGKMACLQRRELRTRWRGCFAPEQKESSKKDKYFKYLWDKNFSFSKKQFWDKKIKWKIYFFIFFMCLKLLAYKEKIFHLFEGLLILFPFSFTFFFLFFLFCSSSLFPSAVSTEK